MTTQSPSIERLKLNIAKIFPIEKVGKKGTEKLSFTAQIIGSDGKSIATENALRYFTFHTSIFNLIKEGAVIDVDVETSQRDYQGTIYTDRKVTQFYQDGKPVITEKQSGYHNKGEYKKDSASIESQVAAKCVSDLLCNGKIPETDPLVKDFKNWCSNKLRASIKSAPAEQEPAVKAEAAPAINIESDFRAACREAGYDLTKQEGIDSVKAWLQKNFKTTLSFKELSSDKQRDAIAAMKKEKLPFS